MLMVFLYVVKKKLSVLFSFCEDGTIYFLFLCGHGRFDDTMINGSITSTGATDLPLFVWLQFKTSKPIGNFCTVCTP
jgi:hypothetical protein